MSTSSEWSRSIFFRFEVTLLTFELYGLEKKVFDRYT